MKYIPLFICFCLFFTHISCEKNSSGHSSDPFQSDSDSSVYTCNGIDLVSACYQVAPPPGFIPDGCAITGYDIEKEEGTKCPANAVGYCMIEYEIELGTILVQQRFYNLPDDYARSLCDGYGTYTDL